MTPGCRPKIDPVEHGNHKQILHIGNGTEPQDLDPHIVTGVPEHNIISALLEGLVAEDPKTLQPIPGVAEDWEVSPDGTVYTFDLRKNAQWSNGDPVTAHDFVFSYKRILAPALGSEYAYMLYVIKNAKDFHKGTITDFLQVGIKAMAHDILEITLENATPYFLSLLNHYSWFPVHPPTILKHGRIDERGTKWTRSENFVGNGPFVLDTWKINDMIIVKKNETYWDADNVRLNAIHFHPIEDERTEERAFRSGQLHITGSVPLSKIEVYKEKKPDLIKISTFLGTYFYRINVHRPPLNDVKVRRALAMAIDREGIVKNVTKGGQQPAYAFTPPDTAGYTTRTRIPSDIHQAKKLLAEAGYPNGMGFPKIELLYNTSEGHRTLAQAIQQMWKKDLNINVKLLNQEWKVYLDTVKQQNYNIARAGWIGDYVDPNTFLDMFVTDGGNNDTGWSNPEYDQRIREVAKISNFPQRMEHFQQAETILLDQTPIIPIYFYTRVYLIQPNVKGWYENLLDHHPYKYVYLSKK
ncbi:MAG: peptide ABC transporter substrate-binding protein [Kiritimatiellae bacterium]|nr:peptide ABC transporter substrate-binding protein [Kiritimatiellia bacterium]